MTYAKDPWQAFHNDFVSYVSLSAENNVEILIKYTARNAVKLCNPDSEMSESSSDSFDGDYSDFQDEFEEEPIDWSKNPDSAAGHEDDVDQGAYKDEPIASTQ